MGGESDVIEFLGCGRGAIGILISTLGPNLLLGLYAGYPSQKRPDRTQLRHCGRVSSHLTRRSLSTTVSQAL